MNRKANEVAARLTSALILLSIPAFAVTLEWGLPMGATVTTSAGSALATVSDPLQFEPDQVLRIPGVPGYKRIVSITGSTVRFDTAASAPVTAVKPVLIADGFDHASARLWFRSDTPVCGSMWFDVQPRRAVSDYRYRSYENNFWYGCSTGTTLAVTVVGLKPSTTYYFRPNARPQSDTADNSQACNTDACGAVEITLATPPEEHDSSGRPPMPKAAAQVPAEMNLGPDTTGYTIFPVPAFADGVAVGTIAANTRVLKLDTVPAGLEVNHWIVIEGTACNNGYYVPKGFVKPPQCQVESIDVLGKLVWLKQTVDTSVTNAPVSWSLFTVRDYLNPARPYAVKFGTVFEWQQGHTARWWPTSAGEDGGLGLRFFERPADDNPKCASHPCAVDDPAHRWIVFRTKAEPGLLPPPGVNVDPEFAPNLGKIRCVTGSPGWPGEFFVAHGTGDPHHYRVETLSLEYPPNDEAADLDPPNMPAAIWLSAGAGLNPHHIVFDRIILAQPNEITRWNTMVWWGGTDIALTNSYLEGFFRKPFLIPEAAPSGNGTSTLTMPAVTYQRSKSDTPAVTEAAVLKATGTAQTTVDVYAYIRPDGLGIRYRSGAGLTFQCTGCAELKGVDAPDHPAEFRRWFKVTIVSGSNTFGAPEVAGWSTRAIEGTIGVYVDFGRRLLFSNNTFNVLGTATIFSDSTIEGAARWKKLEDVTIRRNRFNWPLDHRRGSPVTNGFTYNGRHNSAEFKRVNRLLVEGNVSVGGYASMNHGQSWSISGTSDGSAMTTTYGNEDVLFRDNLLHDQAEIWNCWGHQNSTAVAAKDGRRMAFINNLVYGQNAFVQQERPPNFAYGMMNRTLTGCHDITVMHNTFDDSRSNHPSFIHAGVGSFSEGFYYARNVFHLSQSIVGPIAVSGETSFLPEIPERKSSGSYDEMLGSAIVRFGFQTEPSYVFVDNLITCSIESDVDGVQTAPMDQAKCDEYKAKFGALLPLNLFTSGETLLEREQSIQWANRDFRDYRLLPTSPYRADTAPMPDGRDVGVNMDELDRGIGKIEAHAIAVGGDAAEIVVTAPDKGTGCYVLYGSGPITGWAKSERDASDTHQRLIPISGIVAGETRYQVACEGAPRSRTFLIE